MGNKVDATKMEKQLYNNLLAGSDNISYNHPQRYGIFGYGGGEL